MPETKQGLHFSKPVERTGSLEDDSVDKKKQRSISKQMRRLNSDAKDSPSKSILKKKPLDTSFYSSMSNQTGMDSKKVSFKPTKTVFYIQKFKNQ